MRVLLALVLCLALPAQSLAWGFEAHRFITERALTLLPPALRPLFEKRRAFVIERSIDPDTWRNAGFASEPPNHFVDLDHPAFGPYPFHGLPRDYATAVQAFGREFVHQQGLLPWRVQEFYGMLQRAFESLKQPAPSPYVLDNIVYYSAILSHYVSDGHVPLHSALNYDGQLTGQHGLHRRWETELFERLRGSLRIDPAPPAPVVAPRDFMFDVLLASNRLVAPTLAADAKAAAGREFYDDEYFKIFAAGAAPALEQRVNDSITAVAAVVIGAWERTGRPAVPAEPTPSPSRIRRQ